MFKVIFFFMVVVVVYQVLKGLVEITVKKQEKESRDGKCLRF